jgi:undecaprenyl diphosphate synthase
MGGTGNLVASDSAPALAASCQWQTHRLRIGFLEQEPCQVAATAEYSELELEAIGLSSKRLPRHIAVIMDGNGRWAQARGLPRVEGHRAGVDSVRILVEECARIGIGQLTLYCLSSENWKRPEQELNLLMQLLEQYVIQERSEIMRQGIRFSIIGREAGLSEGALQEIQKTIDCSRDNQGMRLCLALNYGSRAEMTDAVREMVAKANRGELFPEEVDESLVADHLYTQGMDDPDLVIRTAGEMRLSNFLLWQISYAELWVTEKCWPDFRQEDLISALKDFASRDRRFGGLKE